MKTALTFCAAFAFAGCSPKPVAQPAVQPSARAAADLLQEESYWNLAFGDSFADGGSLSLSFIGSDGQIIHVWADHSLNRADAAQRFYLKRTYSDSDAVEVLPGSALEARVIELLTSHHRRPQIAIEPSYARHFIAMLRDRNRPFPREGEWLEDPK